MKKDEKKEQIKTEGVTKFNPFLGVKRARYLFEQYVELAMDGNLESAKLIFPYIFPKPKPRVLQEIKVSKDNLISQAQSVLDFVYTGELDPETAEKILSCMQKTCDLTERTELEQRINDLEEKLNNAKNEEARDKNNRTRKRSKQ